MPTSRSQPPSASAPSRTAPRPASESERAASRLEELRRKATGNRTPIAPIAPAPPVALPKTPRTETPSKPRTSPLAPVAPVANETQPAKNRRGGGETRAQLIERITNPTLTLQEVAMLLLVCPATVRRYSNAGVLPHLRTTGGQRRFRWRDVQALMRDIEARRRS